MTGKEEVSHPHQIDAALADLPDWRYRLGGLVTVYKTPTAAAALELIAAVGRLAEEQNHHPDLDWRYNRVFIRYTSHDAGTEVTQRDVAAAAAASAAAAAAGAAAEPGLYRTVEVVIDTDNPGAISEVWRAGPGLPQGQVRGPRRPLRPRTRPLVPGNAHPEREPLPSGHPPQQGGIRPGAGEDRGDRGLNEP